MPASLRLSITGQRGWPSPQAGEWTSTRTTRVYGRAEFEVLVEPRMESLLLGLQAGGDSSVSHRVRAT